MEKLVPLFKFVHFIVIGIVAYQLYTIWDGIKGERAELDQSIQDLKDKVAKEKKEQNDLLAFVKDVEEAKEKIKKVVEGLDELRRKLPNDNSDVATIEVIQKIVNDINLRDVDLRPEANEQNMGFYLIRNINFKATGTYLQYLLLLENIGNNERIFNMPKVVLTKSSKAQRGRFQLVDVDILINTYRNNPEYVEDTGIQRIEEEFKNGANKPKGKKAEKNAEE